MPTRGAAFCGGAGAFVVGVSSHGAALGGRPRRPVIDMLGANRWPSAGAALDLDFVNRQAYAYGIGLCKPDDLLTYTGSGGTRVNEAGLVAAASGLRFDYDPISVACKGLLVEEQRTNLLLNSGDVSSASWGKISSGVASAPVVTANYGVAPDGTTTAARVQLALNGGSTTADYARIFQTAAVSSGTTYANSVWVRTTDGSTKAVQFRDDAAAVGNAIISVTGTWQRFSLTGAATTANCNAAGLWLRGAQGTSDSADLLVWGGQLEAGAFPTSDIPTGASAVTRTLDVASIVGAKFSSWFNQLHGTFVLRMQTKFTGNASGSQGGVGLDGNQRFFYVPAGASTINSYDGTTIMAGPVVTDGTLHKVASAFDGTNRKLVADGGTVFTASQAAGYTSGGTLAIGAFSPGGAVASGWLASLRFYPQALPDSTLQLMTQ